MSVVLILNAVLAISVVLGSVSLLGWAIVADTAAVARRPERHQGPVHNGKARFPATGPGAVLDLTAEKRLVSRSATAVSPSVLDPAPRARSTVREVLL